MSQENVEIVKKVMPPRGRDYTELFGDDVAWAAMRDSRQALVGPNFSGAFVFMGVAGMEFTGLDGLREAFLEWLGPWTSYYDEVQDIRATDDDRVIVLGRQHGHRLDTESEIVAETAAVYRLRSGKVVRLELYADRSEALEAVGLLEQDAHADS
jgi:ketosteroid isomerase-like protein